MEAINTRMWVSGCLLHHIQRRLGFTQDVEAHNALKEKGYAIIRRIITSHSDNETDACIVTRIIL